MQSPEAMRRLADARGADFDRLFVRMMTEHHQGAVTMATDLLKVGVDQALSEFANSVATEQTVEINRLRELTTPDQPVRATLRRRDASSAPSGAAPSGPPLAAGCMQLVPVQAVTGHVDHRRPSTKALAEMYEVGSRSTVRQAITILIETGELYGHQGLGVFVADREPS